MIRQLKSASVDDYCFELVKIGLMPEKNLLQDLLNIEQTFKFSYIETESFFFLQKYLNQQKIPFWTGKKQSSHQLIISFPNRKTVYDFCSECKKNDIICGEEISIFLENRRKNSWIFSLPHGDLNINKPKIMGILNVTPDSFSDGGKFVTAEKALQHAIGMIEKGADIIDVGAESTRPGSDTVEVEDEWRRLEPVLKLLKKKTNIPISIDTYKSEIAYRALTEGVEIVNDISGLTFDSNMVKVVAKFCVPLIVMHIKGTPRDMQKNPVYVNLMEEIYSFLLKQINYAKSYGINQIIVDPGIGFGKRLADNFEIIRRLGEFKGLGLPILVGPSRKSFIGKTLDLPVNRRMYGTAAALALSYSNGAHLLRVHDVAKANQVLKISQAIRYQRA